MSLAKDILQMTQEQRDALRQQAEQKIAALARGEMSGMTITIHFKETGAAKPPVAQPSRSNMMGILKRRMHRRQDALEAREKYNATETSLAQRIVRYTQMPDSALERIVQDEKSRTVAKTSRREYGNAGYSDEAEGPYHRLHSLQDTLDGIDACGSDRGISKGSLAYDLLREELGRELRNGDITR